MIEGLSTRNSVSPRRFFERRLKARPDPEDLVQEVLLGLIRQGQMDDIQNLGGHVFQVAANVLRDHAGRLSVRKRSDTSLEKLESILEWLPSPTVYRDDGS